MPEYKIYCLDGRGHVFKRHDVACSGDEEAVRKAHAFCAENDVEIWSGARKLCTVAMGTKLPPPPADSEAI